ncbi:MAG: TlpA family protein disulfide reductase [Actinobacteria bacterium]|nr:TlpA family protein disulfide reductase [Actinomycetota bacterium]NDH96005.1 TlpA family protein disulfide reductase [Actinomycetota bacterium]
MSDSPTFRPIRRPVILGVVGLMMFVSACGGGDDVARLTNEPIPLEDLQNDDAIGSDVDIDFTTFDGSTSNFAAYAGTPLVVNFFSRTCAPCVTEMPEFEAVFQAFDGAVAFVGISTDARFDDAELIVEQTGVTYDLGWDPNADVFERFGGFAMPTTVFVDAEGVVRETWSGVLTATELTAKIEDLA